MGAFVQQLLQRKSSKY